MKHKLIKLILVIITMTLLWQPWASPLGEPACVLTLRPAKVSIAEFRQRFTRLRESNILRPKAVQERRSLSRQLPSNLRQYYWTLASKERGDLSIFGEAPPESLISFIKSAIKGFSATEGGVGRILDVGAGNLYISKKLKKELPDSEIFAVDFADINPRDIPGTEGIRFTKASVEALPFSEGVFDAAVASYIFEYVDKDTALKELYRTLRPGGCAIVVLHHPRSSIIHGMRANMGYCRDLIKYYKFLKYLLIDKSAGDAREQFKRILDQPTASLDDKFLTQITARAIMLMHRRDKPESRKEIEELCRLLDEEIKRAELEIVVFEPVISEPETLFPNIELVRRFFELNGFRIVSIAAEDGVIRDEESGNILGYGLVVKKKIGSSGYNSTMSYKPSDEELSRFMMIIENRTPSVQPAVGSPEARLLDFQFDEFKKFLNWPQLTWEGLKVLVDMSNREWKKLNSNRRLIADDERRSINIIFLDSTNPLIRANLGTFSKPNLDLSLQSILRPQAAGERKNALEEARKNYWTRWILEGSNHDIPSDLLLGPGNSFIIKGLKGLFRKNQTVRIVDLGCGRLYVSRAVKREFPSSDLVAVDFVDVDVEKIPGSKGIRFVKASVTDTGLPADYFDVAIIRYVLEFVDRDAMARELHRILKPPGGTAILVLYAPNSKAIADIARMVMHDRFLVEYLNYLKSIITGETPRPLPIEDPSDVEDFGEAFSTRPFLEQLTQVALGINSSMKKEGRTSEVMALARDFLEKRDADIRLLEQEIAVFDPILDEHKRLFASIKEACRFFESKGFNVVSYEGRNGIIINEKSGEIIGYGLVIRKGAVPVKLGWFSRFFNLLPGRSI